MQLYLETRNKQALKVLKIIKERSKELRVTKLGGIP